METKGISLEELESRLKVVEAELVKNLRSRIEESEGEYVLENGEYDYDQLIEDELSSAMGHYESLDYENIDEVVSALEEGEIDDVELEELINLKDERDHLISMIVDLKA